MAQPPTVYFGPDGNRSQHPKVFVRALLYSTAHRAHVVDGMFAKVRRGDLVQSFTRWVCGTNGELARGVGAAVRSEGLALDHHFLLPEDGTSFQFLPGTYRLEVFATLVGGRGPLLLKTVELVVSESQAQRLRDDSTIALYFDWSPETRQYSGFLANARRPSPSPQS